MSHRWPHRGQRSESRGVEAKRENCPDGPTYDDGADEPSALDRRGGACDALRVAIVALRRRHLGGSSVSVTPRASPGRYTGAAPRRSPGEPCRTTTSPMPRQLSKQWCKLRSSGSRGSGARKPSSASSRAASIGWLVIGMLAPGARVGRCGQSYWLVCAQNRTVVGTA
jgi:hypothetical protein